MPCTLLEAHDQILALLPALVTALPVKYPDRPPPVEPFPPAAGSWVRVSISDTGEGRLPPLVGEVGNRRYTADGILTVEIYALSGDGRTLAQQLGMAVLSAYRGKRTPGGVWFRRERVVDVGPDGNWWHVNAIIEYQYDTMQ